MSKSDEYLRRLNARAEILRARLQTTQLADPQEITKELHALEWAIKTLTLSETPLHPGSVLTAIGAERHLSSDKTQQLDVLPDYARSLLARAVPYLRALEVTTTTLDHRGTVATREEIERYLTETAFAPSHAAPVGEDAIQQIMWAIFSYADRREEFAAARLGGPRDVAREAMQAQEKHIRGLLAQLMPSAREPIGWERVSAQDVMESEGTIQWVPTHCKAVAITSGGDAGLMHKLPPIDASEKS